MDAETLCIAVAVGVQSDETGEAMYFDIGEEYTSFGGNYTNTDLIKAQAVLLDLADAITAKLKEGAH